MKNNNNALDNPHDKQFFSALRNVEIARDAIRACVPPELLVKMDLQNIRFYKTKLVSPQMKEFAADIFYEVPFLNSKALLMFHCEQESVPRRTVPLKVWQYLLLVLMEYTENHPNEPLPVPYPVIVYTGEQKFTYSTYLFDLFGDNKELAESLFYKGVPLIDVCRLDDEDIQKYRLFGLCEYAFKHKSTKNFEQCLEILVPWIGEIANRLGQDYAKIMMMYVAHAFINGDVILFVKKIQQHLSKELGDEAMTIAQQLRNEGMQQGMQQGIRQNSHEIAKKLILKGLDEEFIAETTGLRVEEIRKLKKELEPTKH